MNYIFYGMSLVLWLAPSGTLSQMENSVEEVHLVDYCDKIYTLACFKMDAANWMDRFGVNSEFSVIPGVTMVLNSKSVQLQNNDIASELARQFPEDPDSRASQYLAKKLESFLENHSLNVNLSKVLTEETREVTARGKDKKGGETRVILTTGIMIIAVFTQLALWGLAALGGKALITSAISLLFSGILGIKELTSKGNGHVAQAPPVYLADKWDSYSGHSRNLMKPVEVQSSTLKSI